MARVFLTGASGFVGRRVARALDRRGHPVVRLERSPSAEDAGRVVRGDLHDRPAYERHLADADVVVHLAAATGKAPPPEYARTNVEGTRALLEACRAAGRPRFILCSTVAVKFADKRRYHYAQSKEEAERLVRSSGLPFTIVRPTLVAGPGSPVMRGLAALASAPLVPAFGGARARVQPILVDDLAELFVDVVESGSCEGAVLDLGGPEIVSVRELLDRIRRRRSGRPARFLDVPLAPVLPVLRLLEEVALGAVPVTVGQLATFRFDGVVEPNPLWEARRAGLTPLDGLIAASCP